MSRFWCWLALTMTPHAMKYIEPVWGAGGKWVRACDEDYYSPSCAWMKRRQRYRALDTANDFPIARVRV